MSHQILYIVTPEIYVVTYVFNEYTVSKELSFHTFTYYVHVTQTILLENIPTSNIIIFEKLFR